MVKSKTILSIFIVFLMCSGSLTLLAHYNPSQSSNSSNNPIAKPDLSSVSETASTSIGVSYYTLNTAVANSGTTTVTLNSKEASSQQTASIDSTSAYSLNSGNTVGTTTALGGSYQVWINQVNIGTSSDPTIVGEIASSQLYSLAFASGKYTSTEYDVGTVYANLTVDSSIYSWSHTFNSEVTSSTQIWDEFSPSWSGKAPSSGSGPSASGYYTASLQIQITADSGYNFDNSAPAELISFAGSSTTNAINTGEPSQATINFITGWTYSGQSVSSTYTIPQYESSYQISWSTSQSGEIVYNGGSSTSSPINGVLTANSVSFNSNGADPNVSSYTFSYNLSSQYQVSSASATQTASPAYTYSQVSGTTNQASSSFSFSGSTPSSAVFISYETSANSLTTATSNIVFTPTVTIQNPYYTYAQNQLVASLTGASTGSSTTSNTASPSFSGGSATYTASASPSWTVDLNLYGNRHPVYQNSAISLTTVNPLTPVSLYANYSESDFSGEKQYLQSSWNGKSLTSTSSTTDSLSQASKFSTVGSKSITFYANNSPNPSVNTLSSLNSGSNSYSVNVLPFSLTPSPVDYSTVGTSVPLTLKFSTQTSATVSTIDLTVNSVLENRFQPGISSGSVSYTFTQPVSAPLLVQWSVTDQYGYTQSITYQYGSNLTPAEYSNKVTVLQSPNATHSYPITLGSGVPSGTGFYQQLLTITNPSQYGINSADSNIQFTASNGSLLYAWIQSVNQGTEHNFTVWVKNYYGNSVIDMQVLPMFENLFSETGHLGYGRTYFNAPEVFPFATDFSSLSGVTILSGATYVLTSSGLQLYSNEAGNVLATNATFQTNGTRIIANMSFDPHTVNTGSFYPVITAIDYLINNNPGLIVFNNTANPTLVEYGQSSALTNYPFYANETYNVWHNSTNMFSTMNGVDQYSSSYVFDGDTSGSVGIWANQPSAPTYVFMHYLLVASLLGNAPMPTFTIGTGSVFQANATTTSTFTGTSAGNYNSTYENMIYNIPISPNTNYVSILYNSTWTVSNIYPSTYLPLINNSNFVSIEDVSGFSSVQIELIEPNPFIGQSEPVSLSFDPSGVQFQTGDLNHVSYTPFGSSKTASFTTTQNFLQLPFGSLASVYVTNSWGQNIGSTGNFTVTQTNTLTINASVTDITMDPLNGTISTLYISINGYNVSVQPQLSFYLLNNSQYEYYATIPNGNSFPVYSGTIITDSPSQIVTVYGNAPEEGLTLYENAYNQSQSQLGENNSFSTSPFVKLYIDGTAWQQGQTYDTFAGSVIEIHLETVLNQPLNFRLPLSSTLTLTSKNGYLNFTMPAFSPSYQIYITTPSYVFGVINAENVPASSPLATQHNNVSLASNQSNGFHYETMVGQESEVYLLANQLYHFYTHDNITNSINFTLANNTFYVLNGPNITLYQIWLKEQQTNSNVTNAVTHIQMSLVSAPTQIFPGNPLVYKYQAQWQNGTPLNSSDVSSMIITANLLNSTTSNPSTANVNVARSGSYVWFNFTSPASGSFYLFADVTMSPYKTTVSQSVYVNPIVKSSVGMSVSITPAVSPYTNSSKIYQVQVEYGNGTLMNYNDTGTVFLYIHIDLLSGSTILYDIAPTSYSAGYINFTVPRLATGQYNLYVFVPPILIQNTTVHASESLTLNVSPKPVNQLQSFIDGLSQLLNLIAQNLVISIIIALVMAVGVYGIRRLANWISAKLKRDKKDTNSVDMNLIAAASISLTDGPINSQMELATRYAKLSASEQEAFLRVPDGVLVNYSARYGNKETNLMHLREVIKKMNRKENSHELFAFLRKKKGSVQNE